ncbi:MAG: aminotransferase class III-fold pyridoxal phosphate-dependent enzyme, partial [Candidatus Heimdallarchaeota archaeon]
EVKTGFRYSIGGYQSLCNVVPDLSTFGKAVANGYPLGVVGGKEEYMNYFSHQDESKFVLVAGTFNGHFIGSLAGIATLSKLKNREKEIYGYLDELGARMEAGISSIFSAKGVPLTIVRQGSVFTTYFMDKEPENWNDIAKNHDSSFDISFRKKLIKAGVYVVPMSAKQYSISFAHTKKDIDTSLEIIENVVKEL